MRILSLFTGDIISLLSFICVAVGLMGYVGTSFVFDTVSWLLPQIKPYSKVIGGVSVILLCVGFFLRGTIYSNDKWAVKVKTAQAKVAELEAKGRTITEVIKVRTATQIKYIKDHTDLVIGHINESAIGIDSTNVLTNEAIKIYNEGIK